jgi:Icc-related predicted phosphoesterase
MVRIAAVGDLHFGREGHERLGPVLNAVAAEKPDVLLLCGDLTDYGTLDEARTLTRALVAGVTAPMLAVLGNHDFEGNAADGIRDTLRDGGVKVLDGDTAEVKGVGFAGAKGFGGGFGRGALGPWGELATKQFVNEAVQEALKLESALARLRTPVRIVLLHYSPVVATCAGEPLEIYPFLGSSRLEEPLSRLGVSAIFHGHAHKGTLEGRTSSGTPVYNVSLPLLMRRPSGHPLRILEVDATPVSDQSTAPPAQP